MFRKIFCCCHKETIPPGNREIEALKKINSELKEENNNLKELIEEQTKTLTELREEKSHKLPIVNNISNPDTPVEQNLRKRLPIIGEKITDCKLTVKPTSKTAAEHNFLEKAIRKNDLLSRYNKGQISRMIEYMRKTTYNLNDIPIREGTQGDRFYVVEEGQCEVFQGNKSLNVIIKEGGSFGELAILYDCKRTATVKAITPITVWYLERKVFLYVVSNESKQQRSAKLELLTKVPFLMSLKKSKLDKIAGALGEEEYKKGSYIIKEGDYGETFFIVKEGTVSVTITEGQTTKEIREMTKSDCFGEKALRSDNDIRSANVIAVSDVVSVYTLDKKPFRELIGNLADIDWEAKDRKRSQESNKSIQIPKEKLRNNGPFAKMTLESDFKYVELLGAGGFGRVELIQSVHDPNKTFALKCMKRSHIVETRQEEHIVAERNIMLSCETPFIVKLHRTYKNSRYVYMLLEACLGGELWTQLRSACNFPESRAKFYSACVIEALSYLHSKGIVYRDLKPENLLLDNRGYVKLCDFGFAKRLAAGEKSWTFCGTPEYVAPEIILNHGHDIAVDYWALGILIYELLAGNPPFNSADAMRTYRMILRGVDAVAMPVEITRVAQSLIKRLCRENPSERLGNLAHGIDDIRRHRWFSTFNWEHLRHGKITPEFIPIVNSATDVGNFDQFERDEDDLNVPLDDSSWANDF